jgi:hypothetical protein
VARAAGSQAGQRYGKIAGGEFQLTLQDDVLAANDAFYRAFNEKDIEAMDALWSRESCIACTHPGWPTLSERKEIMTSWRGILSNPAQARVVSGGASVTLFGQVAVVVCREFVAGSPLAATNIFVREEDAWRIAHHHSSPVAIAAG